MNNMKNLYYLHETTVIDKNVSIGEKTKIWHFSHIQSEATIGKNCVIGLEICKHWK